MINLVILVFVGGAFGAMFREFVMLMVPHMADGFPLDIFVANVVASFLLGLSTTLHQRVKLHHHVHTMIGTGIMGGLSTFSSFVWAAAFLRLNFTIPAASSNSSRRSSGLPLKILSIWPCPIME